MNQVSVTPSSVLVVIISLTDIQEAKVFPEFHFCIVNKSLVLIKIDSSFLVCSRLPFTDMLISHLFKKSEIKNLMSSSSIAQGV